MGFGSIPDLVLVTKIKDDSASHAVAGNKVMPRVHFFEMLSTYIQQTVTVNQIKL